MTDPKEGDMEPRSEAGSGPTCTCLPLNRRLMAHLLKVDDGSVHEQGCVESAVTEAHNLALDAVAVAVKAQFGWARRSENSLDRAAVLRIIEEARRG